MAQSQISAKYALIDSSTAATLGIGENQWKTISETLGRAPTRYECAFLARVWAEDCSLRGIRTFLRATPKDAPHVRRAPGEMLSKVSIGFGEALVICGGHRFLDLRGAEREFSRSLAQNVVREVAACGAKEIDALNFLRVGDSENPDTQRIVGRVTSGMGEFFRHCNIPVGGGELVFSPLQENLELVGCLAVGFVEENSSEEISPGDSIYIVGEQTADDGLTAKSRIRDADAYRTIVLPQALSEALRTGHVVAAIPLGIGGLARTLSMLALRAPLGFKIMLDQVPVQDMLKKDGQPDPGDVFLSETPGRILIAVRQKYAREAINPFMKSRLETQLIGEVTRSKEFEISWQHQNLILMPTHLATKELEEKSYQLVRFPPMLRTKDADQQAAEEEKQKKRIAPDVLADRWLDLLATPALCSRRRIACAFDQNIGARTLQRSGSDAAVFLLRHSNHPRAVALTLDSNRLYREKDPYLGAVLSVGEAMRNLAATGANPVAVVQFLTVPPASDYGQMSEFAEAVRGVGDACREWEIPVVHESVAYTTGRLPVIGVGMIGILPDASVACSIGFQKRGDIVLLLGETREELGYSEYRVTLEKRYDGALPEIDFMRERRMCDLVYELVHARILSSAHDLSSGGLGVALVESVLSGPRPIGVSLALNGECSPEAWLFGESSGRFLISFSPTQRDSVIQLLQKYDVRISGEGVVGGKEIELTGAVECALSVQSADQIWSRGLDHMLN